MKNIITFKCPECGSNELEFFQFNVNTVQKLERIDINPENLAWHPRKVVSIEKAYYRCGSCKSKLNLNNQAVRTIKELFEWINDFNSPQESKTPPPIDKTGEGIRRLQEIAKEFKIAVLLIPQQDAE